MNLARESAPNQWPPLAGIFRPMQSNNYSTETQIPLSSLFSSQSTNSRGPLYSRMVDIEPRVSVVPILDEWRKQGRVATSNDLVAIIKRFRKYRRFDQALQVCEWMLDNVYPICSPYDIAIQLDLISKVRGLEQAEKYFDTIPDSKKNMHVYGSLLNCYAHEQLLEKAEAVMQKLRDLGCARTPLPYNTMMNLYCKMEKYEKLDMLMQEMEKKHIICDAYTYTIRATAYAAASDVEGLDNFMKKIECVPESSNGWHVFTAAASGYLKAGLKDKAITMLKAAEKRLIGDARRAADYEVLLCTYAGMENKDEVYRVWNLIKQTGKLYNKLYHSMICSLLKLGDMVGAEKIVKEWESTDLYFDVRIPKAMIYAYCENGLLQKAIAYVDRLVDSGKELPASIWDRLASGYYQVNQMENAVKTMTKAFLVSHPWWRPNQDTVAACIDYLKANDEEKASEFVDLMNKHCHQSSVMNGHPEEVELDERQKLEL